MEKWLARIAAIILPFSAQIATKHMTIVGAMKISVNLPLRKGENDVGKCCQCIKYQLHGQKIYGDAAATLLSNVKDAITVYSGESLCWDHLLAYNLAKS